MRKTIIFLSALSLILWSCNHTDSTMNHEENHEHEMHHDMHEHEEEQAEAIELNDGKKWKVNAEMMPFILNGKEIVTKFIAENHTEYTKLATELEAQNSQLIQSCTMDGKSHDELHKWLHPHLELVASLKDANQGEAKELVTKLKTSYDNFSNYFE